jgi:hypothetical protein
MLKRLRPAAVVATVAVAAGFVLPLLAAAPASADVAAKGGDFVAVSPRQAVLDTRSGLGAPVAQVGAGKTISVTVLGTAGVPSTGVRSVALVVTGLVPSANSAIFVWPTGGSQPANASFNLYSGVSASSSVIVGVGTGGKVSIYNSAGNVNVTASVSGYFTTATAGSGPGGYIPITESKLVNTASGAGGVPVGQLAAGKSVTATLANVGGIPAGAYAVYGVLELTGATSAGTVTADAAGVSDSQSSMSYGKGETATGVLVKLSSSGQLTFKNVSGSAVNLYYNVQGYFAGDSAHGYGYRTTPATTLLAGITMAAGADLDVQVAGRGGIPTRGAGAVQLTLATTAQTTAGYLRAWPADGTPPTSGAMVNWNGTDSRAAESIVPLGTTGVIRLHNYNSSSVHAYLIIRGWFDTGQPHDVAIEQNAPLAVLQAVSGGSVDASYVNAGGVLFHGVAAADSLDQPQWSPVPSNLEAFTGQPSIVRLPSGNLLVSVLHANNGEVWNFQVAAGLSSWTPTFTHTGGIMASPPVSANLPDGNVLTFAVDSDGALWLLPATGAIYWQDLGAANLAGMPTVVTTSTGVQLVGRTTSGTVETASYVDGALSVWTDLGGTGVTDKTAAVVNNGPRVRVVARQSDGTVISKLQNLNGSWPATWTQAGSAGMSPAFIGAPAVGIDLGSGTSPGTGKAFLLARSADDGYLYQVDETGPASGVWGEWYLVPGQPATAGTDATVTPFGGGANNFHWIAAYLDSTATPRLIHQ